MADTMIGLKRTNYCGETTRSLVGQEVVVSGWVQKLRDKGMLVFVDLRDRTGLVQLAFDDATHPELRAKAQSVRSEYVLMAKGTVRLRESANPDLPNGDVEVYVTDLRILAKASTPPFEITDTTKVNEELRLRHRYLDLRRGQLQRNLMLRHRVVKAARDYFDRHGFLEIETPTLIRSTPEGARDYLVPSRVHPGSFYALPQSPQLYKQLLMLAGYDRYLQVARCYRDEDLRADRQPEFTQIDLEMSFVDEEDVQSLLEGFMAHVFREVLGLEIETPFRRLPYEEAMNRYGSDKPDTRFGLELRDLSDLVRDTEFQVFRGAIQGGGSVRGINVKGAAQEMSRKEIDKLTTLVRTYKAGGLAFTRLTADGETSSYEKFLTPGETQAIRARLGAESGDLLLLVADADNQIVYDSLGALRGELAKRLNLIQPDTFDLLWVTQFPLLEYSPDDHRYVAKHHPFTSPMVEDMDKLESDPGACRARAYDLVLNGSEVGGGSIRINDLQLQQRMFSALGFTPEQAQERFGFLLEAFRYGAPPHGGLALGLDRLVMLLAQEDSIKEVIAFPKVQNASELMTSAPGPVDQKDLDQLSIRLTPQGE